MNVLVIGGTGFISGRVVDILLARGHDVTIFTRGTSERLIGGPVEHLRGDRRSAASIAGATRNKTFDVVCDMVAYEAADSRALLEGLHGKVGRLVHCSTVSVYMVSHEPRCPITEDQDDLPLMDHWPRNPFGMDYGIRKRACEAELQQAHEAADVAVTCLRPTYVCGPRDKTLRDYFWIQRILDGGPLLVPGSGDHAFQLVYVDDAARAFVDASETGPKEWAYNVVGEDIFSLNEYLRRTAALLDREVELVHVDQEAFDRLDLSSDPGGDVFPFNTRRTAVFSLDRAKRDLHYRSTPFERWMETTIRWYIGEYEGDSLGYDRRSEEIARASFL